MEPNDMGCDCLRVVGCVPASFSVLRSCGFDARASGTTPNHPCLERWQGMDGPTVGLVHESLPLNNMKSLSRKGKKVRFKPQEPSPCTSEAGVFHVRISFFGYRADPRPSTNAHHGMVCGITCITEDARSLRPMWRSCSTIEDRLSSCSGTSMLDNCRSLV